MNMMRFYDGLAGNGETVVPYIVKPTHGPNQQSLGLTQQELDGLRRALMRWSSRVPPGPTGAPTWRWQGRPVPLKIPMEMTTGGSLVLPRPTSQS